MFGPDAIARRALEEIDRRGWERFVVAADSWAALTALRVMSARSAAVEGFAFGHARLSNRMTGERAPLNRELVEAMGQLLMHDHRSFVRHGFSQFTHGSVGDELADRILDRVPLVLLRKGWEMAMQADEPLGDRLQAFECPLLFGRHERCLVSTEEGFEDAAAAFPHARTVGVPDAPCVSPEFGEALRSFCAELPAARR